MRRRPPAARSQGRPRPQAPRHLGHVRDFHRLPTVNRQFPRPLVPYFQPFCTGGEQARYLSEDYAFCERATQEGAELWADTTIRLWHVGHYNYGWEDAGREVQRFGKYTYHLPAKASPT